jgi:hypothetical protein
LLNDNSAHHTVRHFVEWTSLSCDCAILAILDNYSVNYAATNRSKSCLEHRAGTLAQ